MTPRQAFLTRMTALAQMVPNFSLTRELLLIYENQLKDVGYEKLVHSLDKIIGERSSRDPFPSVKEIRETVEPRLNIDSEAAIIANQIVEAIARCGPYTTPLFDPIAKRIVQMEGGWQNVCEMITNSNLATYKAQWRNLAKALLEEKSVQGSAGPTITDQRRQNSGGLVSFSSLLEMIPRSESEPETKKEK